MILPTYTDLKNRLPLTDKALKFILNSRRQIKDILQGHDKRLLIIVGPCSIHDRQSAIEFALLIKELNQKVCKHFLLVMRVYCEKPRTKEGWKGFLYDPFLDNSMHIEAGITQTRQLLMELAEIEVPAATEFLDPLTTHYYQDLISWGSIGARTSSSQIHRHLASSLSMPVGIKNGIAGNISSAIDGIVVASHPHTYIGINSIGFKSIIKSNGNPDAHLVLRGGESGPNYEEAFVKEAIAKLKQANINCRLLIDCSHHNSRKLPLNQISVFQHVFQQILTGNKAIKGCMLESHLFAGNQPLNLPQELAYGVSITDPCLDWHTTQNLICWAAQTLTEKNKN